MFNSLHILQQQQKRFFKATSSIRKVKVKHSCPHFLISDLNVLLILLNKNAKQKVMSTFLFAVGNVRVSREISGRPLREDAQKEVFLLVVEPLKKDGVKLPVH